MSYGFPPYDSYSSQGPVTSASPETRHIQPPPQDFSEQTGTYNITVTHPPQIQRGSTIRFKFQIAHVTDGAIGTTSRPFTVPLTAVILDKNRQPTLSTYFSVGTVTADPSNTNAFYSDVTVQTICELDYFEVVWAGSYTPVGSSTPLPFRSARGFRVFQPANPGKHYFYATSSFGAR